MEELLADLVVREVLAVHECTKIAYLGVVLLIYLLESDEVELNAAQEVVLEEQIVVRHLDYRQRGRDYEGLLAMDDEGQYRVLLNRFLELCGRERAADLFDYGQYFVYRRSRLVVGLVVEQVLEYPHVYQHVFQIHEFQYTILRGVAALQLKIAAHVREQTLYYVLIVEKVYRAWEIISDQKLVLVKQKEYVLRGITLLE